jgi:hypothetical protein
MGDSRAQPKPSALLEVGVDPQVALAVPRGLKHPQPLEHDVAAPAGGLVALPVLLDGGPVGLVPLLLDPLPVLGVALGQRAPAQLVLGVHAAQEHLFNHHFIPLFLFLFLLVVICFGRIILFFCLIFLIICIHFDIISMFGGEEGSEAA